MLFCGLFFLERVEFMQALNASETSQNSGSKESRIERQYNVLIVDDDQGMRTLLQTLLKDSYQVFTADSGRNAFDVLKNYDIDVILLDIRLGSDNGIEMLSQIKKDYKDTEVVMITVIKDIRTAIESIKLGAFDYINKDFEYEEVKLLVEKAIQKRRLFGELQTLRDEIKEITNTGYIVGFNRDMIEVDKMIMRIAKTPSNVLLSGESGTGKEVVARKIHTLCWEDKQENYAPFVGINIASIPNELMESTLFGHEKGSFTGAHRTHKGKFELANGGTLFLDEIGELRLDLQSKLLRAVQERKIERVGGEALIPVNTRLIVATHQDLKEKVRRGEFREDLYYRLNVIPIQLPPLRERLEDLPEFINLFLKRSCKKLNKKIIQVHPNVLECFQCYSWPGNIRELENIIERMVALSTTDTLVLEDVPLELRFLGGSSIKRENPKSFEEILKEATAAFEKRVIISALHRHGWNQVKTSQELGIHRKTLEYKIKRLNLQKIIEQNRKNRQKMRSSGGVSR